jgi:hypothetical protein
MSFIIHSIWEFWDSIGRAEQEAQREKMLEEYKLVAAYLRDTELPDLEPLDYGGKIFALLEASEWNRTAGEIKCVWMTAKALRAHLCKTLVVESDVFRRFQAAFEAQAELVTRVDTLSVWDNVFTFPGYMIVGVDVSAVEERIAAFDRGSMRLVDPFNKSFDQCTVSVASIVVAPNKA